MQQLSAVIQEMQAHKQQQSALQKEKEALEKQREQKTKEKEGMVWVNKEEFDLLKSERDKLLAELSVLDSTFLAEVGELRTRYKKLVKTLKEEQAKNHELTLRLQQQPRDPASS